MMNKLIEITKILNLYKISGVKIEQYQHGKTSLLFLDESDKVNIAQMYDALEDGLITIHSSREATEDDICDTVMYSYRMDAQSLIFDTYLEQMRQQLYVNFIQNGDT